MYANIYRYSLSWELSLSRTYTPGSENVELSPLKAKRFWNFRSSERKSRGIFVPGSGSS